MRKVLFINVPWMKRYEGAMKGEDEPRGKFGSTIRHPMSDHCQFNFKKFGGKVYGHVPGSTNPNLTRLGAGRSDQSKNGITVVWIATDPDSAGRVIVGWFKNATIWKQRQLSDGALARQRRLPNSDGPWKFSVEAFGSNAKCLLPGKRPPLNVENGKPGQSSFWYGNRSANAQAVQLVANGFSGKVPRKADAKNARGGWIQDVAVRLKIEANAMEAVKHYFSKSGYDLEDRSRENAGYDMLATSEAAELHLEVKGNKGKTVCIELTPNEFSFARGNPDTFRLCVVLDALNANLSGRTVRIFKPFANGTEWRDESGFSIRTIKKTGAVIRE